MHNQILRAIIFVVLVIVVTSDLKQMVSIMTGFNTGPAVATLHGWLNPLENKKSPENNIDHGSDKSKKTKPQAFTTNFNPGKFRNKIINAGKKKDENALKASNLRETALTGTIFISNAHSFNFKTILLYLPLCFLFQMLNIRNLWILRID